MKKFDRPLVLPVGYELIESKDDLGRNIFAYKFAGIQSQTWHDKYTDCVDHMWVDVRARATRVAAGGIALPSTMQNTLAYAFGWTEAKQYLTDNIRQQCAAKGYSWAMNETPEGIISRLLTLISPSS